jgi:hypothetical protein
MAKVSKVKGAGSEPEMLPDAWERFERAVGVVAKSPPQPKKRPVKITKKKQRKTKRRKSA